jgi:hypothetical protein
MQLLHEIIGQPARQGTTRWYGETLHEREAVAIRYEHCRSRRPCPRTCPKHRSTAVTNGHQRSVASAPDLHQRLSMSGRTVLPKLAVGMWKLRPKLRTTAEGTSR